MKIYKAKNPTKDGRAFYFKTEYKDADGIIKPKISKKYLTRAEAIKAGQDFIFNIETYGFDVPVDMTFNQLFKLFVEHQSKHLKVATIKCYKNDFKKFKSFHSTKVSSFTAEAFESWKKDFLVNYSYTTIRYKNTLVKFWKTLLNYAMTWHGFRLEKEYKLITFFVDNSPYKRELNYYTEKEFLTYIELEDDLAFRCFFKILYYCGIRTCEIRALSWKDINLRNHTLTIRKHYYILNKTVTGKSYEIANPKFGGALRTITMHRSLCKDLNKLHELAKSDPDFKKSYFVFGGSHPTPLFHFERRNERNAMNSDLKRITFREFRHSCAYRIVKYGGNIITICGILGLTEITDAYDLYRAFLPVEMENIISVINSLNKQ